MQCGIALSRQQINTFLVYKLRGTRKFAESGNVAFEAEE
jgi:hypothetical protein